MDTQSLGDQPVELDGKKRWMIGKGVESDCNSDILPIRKVVIGSRSELSIEEAERLLQSKGHVDVLVSKRQ